jgi:hypothetical protein
LCNELGPEKDVVKYVGRHDSRYAHIGHADLSLSLLWKCRRRILARVWFRSHPRLSAEPNARITFVCLLLVNERSRFPDGVPQRIGIILGAGASRSVSYAHEHDIRSPLDADFFDLLQRVEVPSTSRHKRAVQSVVAKAQKLPYEYWRSMERAFYTIHLRASLQAKLKGSNHVPEDRVIREFAQSVQVLLRKAHGTRTCNHHQRLVECLHQADTVISFNYDLVPERALKPVALARKISFGDWLYGLTENKDGGDLPLILKLHGSSNWRPARGPDTPRFDVLTKRWGQLDESPGYRGHHGEGSAFPILLPFWDKRVEQAPWLPIWRNAFKRLEQLDVALVWGYSLPQTDIKAQHLFNLSLASKAIKLCVIDPSSEIRRRWRELLPRALFFPFESIDEFFRSPPSWWSGGQI